MCSLVRGGFVWREMACLQGAWLNVDGVRDDGMWIKTSLVRNDTGAGSCEVLLVSDVTLDD